MALWLYDMALKEKEGNEESYAGVEQVYIWLSADKYLPASACLCQGENSAQPRHTS